MRKPLCNETTACIILLIFLLLLPSTPEAAEKPILRIAYLPILDHLTLLIAHELSKTGEFEHFHLQPIKTTSWTELVDAIKSGRLDGAFVLVPLGMHLREKGIGIKLVLLGQRNGSAFVVRPQTDSVEGLKGGLVAIPHVFSMHHILLYKYWIEKHSLSKDDLTIIEVEPPDMAPSLVREEIDGFLVAQPFPTQVEVNKTGKILAYSSEISENHLCCGLFLLESVLAINPARIEELVRELVKAGEFIESNPREAARMASPYIGLNEEIIYKVLTSPPEGIIFKDLAPEMKDMEEVQRYLLRLGLLEKEMDLKGLIEDSFVKEASK
jgi:NitT/TauT family transport system substrate-binding protein